jgi:hypothetical protein
MPLSRPVQSVRACSTPMAPSRSPRPRRGMAVAAVIGTVEKRRPMMNVAAKQTFQQSFDQEAATIEIRLSRPQQLLNSLDPSPFHDRDLDQDAEDYLVDSADEYPLKKPLIVIIHLPADHLPPGSMPDLGQAIHNYFQYRMNETRRRLKFFFRDGRIALVAALAFLLGCILLRQVVLAVGQGVGVQIVDEGLYIVGWVAMWRPLEIFLYDWRPIWHRYRLFAKLASVPVVVRMT